MPPKKSEKAVAAEIKKKNTAVATDIVAMLKRSSQRDKISSGKSSKIVDASTMERLFDSAKTVKVLGANPPEKHEKTTASESKKKNIDAAKEVVLKKTFRKDTVSTATTTKAVEADSIEVESEIGVSGPEADVDQTGAGSSGITEHHKAIREKTRKSYSRKSDQIETKSKASNKAKSAPRNSKIGSGQGCGTGYQYKIDCELVSDTIEVTDLKRYVETELKVNGQKNNLGSTIKVCCEGKKVVVESKVYLPKKALRHLSRKFLKKNWNIRVVSKDKHSYEYKYVGTL